MASRSPGYVSVVSSKSGLHIFIPRLWLVIITWGEKKRISINIEQKGFLESFIHVLFYCFNTLKVILNILCNIISLGFSILEEQGIKKLLSTRAAHTLTIEELTNEFSFALSFSPQAFPQAISANSLHGANLDPVFNLILHSTCSKQDLVHNLTLFLSNLLQNHTQIILYDSNDVLLLEKHFGYRTGTLNYRVQDD